MIEFKLERAFMKRNESERGQEKFTWRAKVDKLIPAFPLVFMSCHWSPLNFNLPISKLFKSIFAVLSWYWFSCYFLPHFYFIFSRLKNFFFSFLFSSSFCGCQKFLLLSFHVPFKKRIFISTAEKIYFFDIFIFTVFIFLLALVKQKGK
jgi:hypothetical protein